MNALVSIYDVLYDLFEKAIDTAYPDLSDPPIVIALSGNNPKFGDYQCNSSMPLCKLLGAQGKHFNPALKNETGIPSRRK